MKFWRILQIFIFIISLKSIGTLSRENICNGFGNMNPQLCSGQPALNMQLVIWNFETCYCVIFCLHVSLCSITNLPTNWFLEHITSGNHRNGRKHSLHNKNCSTPHYPLLRILNSDKSICWLEPSIILYPRIIWIIGYWLQCEARKLLITFEP